MVLEISLVLAKGVQVRLISDILISASFASQSALRHGHTYVRITHPVIWATCIALPCQAINVLFISVNEHCKIHWKSVKVSRKTVDTDF